MTKNILSLDSDEAMDFLMKSEQYHNFELPEYFDFNPVLRFVAKAIGDKPYGECLSGNAPAGINDVNFGIMLNKDGKYAVRPLTLCNPYMYYFLVRGLCAPGNWKRVKAFFEACRVPHIKSCALPVIPDEVESFYKSATILNWWNEIEQRSLELSLKFRYMFVSDITNCYGSINPESIDWALSMKGTAKATDANHDIAQSVIRCLSDMQQGRNIGIPQGSCAFDVVAEVVLGYADLLLHERLQKLFTSEEIKEDYEILRYRDDYRIFCNNKDLLERISYILQQVLEELSFRMNSSKTHITCDVVADSIKADKLYYIANTPIFNKKGCDFDGIQKHLIFLLLFGRKYPNSGQLRTMLSDLDKRIEKKLKPHKETIVWVIGDDGKLKEPEDDEKEIEVPGKLVENVRAMSAVAVQIAIENVAVAHYALRVVSRMTNSLEPEDRNRIANEVREKLINQPNSTYTKLWLQNMTYSTDVEQHHNPYSSVALCQLVMGHNATLWNNSWLKPELVRNFPQKSVVNRNTLDKVTPVITFRETRAYNDWVDKNQH